MNKSESIAQLAAALAKAQSDFPGIPKDKTVQVTSKTGRSYTFAYAPLDTIMDKIRPTLRANGLAFMQSLNGESLTTTLLHTSGEWLASDPMPIRVVDAGPQALGSAITYARRYALTAILGLVTEDDDDGNAAEGQSVTAAPFKKAHSPTDGCFDALDKNEQEQAREIALSICDHWSKNRELAAYEAYYQQGYSNEMLLGVWELLKPHSAMRRKLKEMHETPTTKKAA
jgi:hypothetical protein